MTAQKTGGPVTTTRRTLVKGAAWSVPVVAMAQTAHAVGASQSCLESGLCFGCATVHKCCSGGPQAMYWACITFTNEGVEDVMVSFNFTVNTSANGLVEISGGGAVPAGQTVRFKPETPRQYGNCSTGTYDAFVLHFTDGTNHGTVNIPGGSIDGGGNTCPQNTDCAC
ncbi:hypothetical protein [Ornithinimicrobium humiphilum]|nr:hypothetical protein [Ornithinimicrobium humiphilum]